MDYKQFLENLGIYTDAPYGNNGYVLNFSESLTKQQVADLVVADCPNLNNIYLTGNNTVWYLMLPNSKYLTENFPATVNIVTPPIEDEEPT